MKYPNKELQNKAKELTTILMAKYGLNKACAIAREINRLIKIEKKRRTVKRKEIKRKEKK